MRKSKNENYYNYYGQRKGIRWDYILFAVGLVIFVAGAAFAFIKDMQESKYKETMHSLKDMQEIVFASKALNAQGADGDVVIQSVSYEKIFALNDDMVGWLNIPGTVIDYPVMQTMDDEEYYIDKNFYGESDKNGCLILDTDSDIEKTSNNLIIHGHNMKSGNMFGTLKKYSNQEYGQEHSTILFSTKTETRTYQVVSVIRSKVYTNQDDVFKYYDCFETKTEEEFDYFYNNIKKESLYDTGVSAKYGDEFITLSTCSSHTQDGRLAVIAKRVD